MTAEQARRGPARAARVARAGRARARRRPRALADARARRAAAGRRRRARRAAGLLGLHARLQLPRLAGDRDRRRSSSPAATRRSSSPPRSRWSARARCVSVGAMRATGFTHVSIHAYDLEESMRFYTDVFGMRRVPEPRLPRARRSSGSRSATQQLHLFQRDTPAPEFHHIGLDVDDFEAAYTRGAASAGCSTATRGRPTCASSTTAPLQMYLRDPAGNLVEVNWPDASTLDRSVVTAIDEHRRRAPAERRGAARDACIRVAARTGVAPSQRQVPILDSSSCNVDRPCGYGRAA